MRSTWRRLAVGTALIGLSGCSAPTNLMQPSISGEPLSAPVSPSLVGRITVAVEERFHSGQPGTLTITPDGGDLARLSVSWGDGTVTDVESARSGVSHRLSHVYPTAGTYLLTIQVQPTNTAEARVSTNLFVD